MIVDMLACLSIDFGKEVTDSFNRILVIVGIVLLVILLISIISAIIIFATRVTKFSNEVKMAKELRKNKKKRG